MSSFSYRGILFLVLSAFLILAQVGEAFVNQQSATHSLSVNTKLPKLSHLPVQNFFSYEQKQPSCSALMATEPDSGGLPFWLDPGTRGGAVVLSVILFVLPLIGYAVATSIFGIDGVEAGKYIGVGFTAVATLLWVSTYVFRVATKDMTYVSTVLFSFDCWDHSCEGIFES